MASHKSVLACFCGMGDHRICAILESDFEVHCFSNYDSVASDLQQADFQAVLVDLRGNKNQGFTLCERIHEDDATRDLPVLFIDDSEDLQDKLRCFEVGGDDYLMHGILREEFIARIMKCIFNKIANDQLKSRVRQANAMAMAAMANTSDLGITLRFMIDTASCDNLDQLGQLFFQAARSYGLSCSLQMRSEFGVKNMEENGMAKELESNLLWQMKDAGRYYDFGRRTVMNYGLVSVLVKNMPVEDSTRYGVLKDNTFPLLQGLDAHIRALDNQESLKLERDLLAKMSRRMQGVMEGIDVSYRGLIKQIVESMEHVAGDVLDALPSMALNERDERLIEQAMERAIVETNRIFNRGLKVDEGFQMLLQGLNEVFGAGDATITPARLHALLRQLSPPHEGGGDLRALAS